MGASHSHHHKQCHSHQSPINICTKKVQHDPFLKPIKIQYDPKTTRKIVNKGHCFNVEFDDATDMSVLSDGPLTGNYRLLQFHFHWGSTDETGSEHVIDGKVYPAEMHIVHWNSQRYLTFEEAAKHPDGLAVIGILLKIGETNTVLQTIIDNLDQVKTKGKEYTFTKYDLSSLLPKDLNYWTYPGSLTTEPYFECVTWIVLQEAIPISSQQLAQFRSLLCTSENENPVAILKNHRPVQRVHDRVVRSSRMVNKKASKP
ncbi:carbonic anhydrase 13-like [Pelobates fuscus]|uniref:carbonic anhydrase 13-like n=1 Tax=Pelobates fuscus TaxID=191477 RepID=UPI002FE46C16